jgi:uncharacterized protein YmfQ (DUF2313 family)
MSNLFAGLTSVDYLAAAKALLPRGRALAAAVGSVQEAVLSAIADLCAALHADAIRLIDVECDPHTTDEMLADFETAWGLPDPCLPDPETVEKRRLLLVARIGDKGGLNKQRYIDLAATLGLTVTVDEIAPFIWRMNVPEAVTVTTATCTDPSDVQLRSWGDPALECAVLMRNRASCRVLFAYQG